MKKVLLLLANGFEILEASAFIDVIGWNMVEGDRNTALYTAGNTRIIHSTFNQSFNVDLTLEEVQEDAFDALAIPGGFEQYGFFEDAFSESFQNMIRAFDKQRKVIASVCVGALALGKSGILENRTATTYCLNPVRKQQLKDFGAQISDLPIVNENHIISSDGPSTAINVAFLLLEKLTSSENVLHVRKLMGYDREKPK
ncbi:MAG TPA: DJ-1 family protein [Saprospirales bacterium]|nr:DJ-1 family protein [Saprospirales bacterium]HRQ29323.1 DJ-1/PfpI family protein [Saprospiraceae bacterium]